MHQRIAINKVDNPIIYISTTSIDHGFLTNLHSHPTLELLLITKGEGHILTTNRKIPVKEGDIVAVNPNSKHCEIGEGLSFLAIGIQKTDIYLKETYTKKIIARSLKNEDYQEIHNLYNLIYKEAILNDAKSSSIMTSAFNIIYELLDRAFGLTKTESDISTESDLISNIKSILNAYYSSDIKLDELSHRLSISRSSLCHIFKKETGMTIIEYKLNVQLSEALNLLEISDMSITEISSLVGFNSSSYFIKQFKNKYGITPVEYRKELPNLQ